MKDHTEDDYELGQALGCIIYTVAALAVLVAVVGAAEIGLYMLSLAVAP